MSKSYIFEGNTTNDAIHKGLKELNVTKDKVEIKVLENDKRSFFSILSPRIVKVEMMVKEEFEQKKETNRIEKTYTEEELKKQEQIIREFLDDFISKLPSNNIQYNIESSKNTININMTGENINYLIGYRAETLNAFQNILVAVLKKHVHYGARILLNINGYREKRDQTLKELAEKIAKTVIRTGKSVTLEPMSAYERKIIHYQLGENEKVKTHSVGEEPYRRVVIELK